MCGFIKEIYVFSLLQEKNIPNAYFYTIEKIIKDLLGEYSMIFTTIAFIAFSQRYGKYSFQSVLAKYIKVLKFIIRSMINTFS